MPTVKELQSKFCAAVYDNDTGLEAEIVDANISPKSRIAIYRNNVMVTLHETFKSRYPAVFALVGDKFFRYAVNEYIKKHKPASGNLDDYGREFDGFIAGFEPAKKLPYLPDVAKLEWLLHEAYFAADCEPINKAALSGIAPEKLEHLVFTLHPSTGLMSSPYPVDKIWNMTQGDDVDVDINSGGADVLVVRPALKTEIIALEDGELEFLRALGGGENLYNAFEKAASANEQFDVGMVLEKFVGGVLVSFVS